jgi:glutamine cyclotransferase
MKTKLAPSGRVISALLIAAGIILGQGSERNPAKSMPEYTVEIIHQFPHDSTAFTQGFA